MLMIRPLPCSRMCGRAIWTRRARPKRLTSNCRRASSSGTSSIDPYDPYPALFTSTSIRPVSSITCFTPATMDASSVRSRPMTRIPASCRDCIRSVRRATAYTVNPPACSSRAVCSPIPDEAPVTRATLESDIESPLKDSGLLSGHSTLRTAEVKVHWSVNIGVMTVADFQRARSPQQQEQRRRAILDAARQMLDQAPLTEISLRELSRQVGLAKSNVVRYFPTREAVFLALLVDDWDRWLDVLQGRLPRQDGRRTAASTQATLASVIAESLGEQPRLCDLIANSQLILERNIPLETAREFKAAAFARTQRLAQLVSSVVPVLDDAQAYEFAGVVWALVAGAWPIAHPSPVVACVLAEPDFAGMCVDFVPALTRILTF